MPTATPRAAARANRVTLAVVGCLGVSAAVSLAIGLTGFVVGFIEGYNEAQGIATAPLDPQAMTMRLSNSAARIGTPLLALYSAFTLWKCARAIGWRQI